MLWWGRSEGTPRQAQIEAADKHGLIIENTHADFYRMNSVWAPGYDGDARLDELMRDIAFCGGFGISPMIIHLTNGIAPPPVSDIGLRRLETLFEFAKAQNVTLAIENIEAVETTRYILDHYSEKHITFCYDSGHENVWANKTDWLALYGDRLAAIHLHNNYGKSDEHSDPFLGTVDWDSVLPKLRNSSYNGSITLESRYKGEADAEKLETFLENLYQSGLKLAGMLRA